MGKFSIKTGKNGDYYFNLKAVNGQIILASQGYSNKAGCENGIESVRKNANDDARFERNEAKNGQHYFNLKASNGQIIGTSEMYTTKAAMENGIESVGKNAPEATLVMEE
ncbi:MAG: YegP family protein [Bacteroidetes bacterium]|nr:YegP family protein [Bacteroidota bacterium]